MRRRAPSVLFSCSLAIGRLSTVSLLCVVLTALGAGSGAWARETKVEAAIEHDYVSCSIITSEHLTTLQLFQRGVSLDTALESLPRISQGAKKRVAYIYSLARNIGILNAYADINTNYARCSTKVYKKVGKPILDENNYGYYFCAGENKIRYEILLYSDRYMNLDKVLQKTPDTHMKIAIEYFNLIENKGLLAAFDLTANNLKACLNNLQAHNQ